MSGACAAALSLGARSQLLATAFDAETEDHGDWLVVRTPSNPTYYWGNYLVTHRAPADADLDVWLRRAQAHVTARQPASDHVALLVDGELAPDTLPSWRAAGFTFDHTAVLALEPAGLARASAPRVDGAAVRRLVLPAEAGAAAALQALCNDQGFDAAGYRTFRDRVMARTSRMDALGLSHWYGVFVGDTLVADCGLVFDTALARFRDVETHPAWRRRGCCRALVHHVCRDAFERLRVPRLVMCADPDDVAIGIYESVGFRRVGAHWQVQRRAAVDRP